MIRLMYLIITEACAYTNVLMRKSLGGRRELGRRALDDALRLSTHFLS